MTVNEYGHINDLIDQIMGRSDHVWQSCMNFLAPKNKLRGDGVPIGWLPVKPDSTLKNPAGTNRASR